MEDCFAIARENSGGCPERGRLRIGAAQILEALAGHPSYGVLAIDVDQGIQFGALSGLRNPMDRMIVAAARVTGSRLLTADAALGASGVEIVWA